MKRAHRKVSAPHSTRALRTVRSPKLAHLVAEQLREQIANGRIGPGDTLPSETELLEQFGISRPTLREALRVLESETLIQLGRGSRTGATVLGPSIEPIAESSTLYLAVKATTMGELHEVRTLLEPSIAASLARRRKRDFVKELQRCNEQQAQALQREDYAALMAAVNEYHDLLVKFSENRALSLLAGILHAISVKLHPQALIAADRRNQRPLFLKACETGVAAHRQLTKLIGAGKASEAERFWRSHMTNSAKYLADLGMANLRVRSTPASR